MPGLAPLVAVIGCDGSGKSTLAQDLYAHFATRRPTAMAYLGLKSGAMGEAIKRWPLIGPWFEAQLSRRAAQARDTARTDLGMPSSRANCVYVHVVPIGICCSFCHTLC